ncbi:MAG: tetratricopeptide repeat protein [Candidatus Aureabacteria bacterium]|nr:tetratricopeptide repeat protein [Candidatus Auribacterota bacterium]
MLSEKKFCSLSSTQVQYALLLILLVFIIYFPVIQNEFVNWDDNINIYDVGLYHQSDALKRIWFSFDMPSYLPLTDTLWYLEAKVAGTSSHSAGFYHWVSIVLHLMNVLLVFILTGKWGFNPLISFFCAALFGVHPLRVENVAWATEQKSLLSGVFVWLSWIYFLKRAQQDTDSLKASFVSLVFFCFSLLSKQSAIFLPVIFILADWYRGKDFRGCRSFFIYLPYLMITFIFSSIHYYREVTLYYAAGRVTSFSALEHLLLAPRVLAGYIRNFLWPMQLNLVYPKWDPGSGFLLNWVYFAVFVTAISALFLSLIRRKYRLMVFCLFSFILFLLPVSGLIDMPYLPYSFISDRHMYLPLLFVVVPVVYGLMKIPKKIGIILLCFLFIWWGKITSDMIPFWRNSVTLYHHATSLQRDFFIGYFNLGNHYFTNGRFNDAKGAYLRCLEIQPSYLPALTNLGYVAYALQSYDEALIRFRQVLAVQENPYAREGLELVLRKISEEK